MVHVGNINQLGPEFVKQSGKTGNIITASMSEAGQSERLYAHIDRLNPGAKSVKFHSHSLQEEFFLVLRGECQLRVGDEVMQLRRGDFFCKPAGSGLAHQFINNSNDIVEILDVGINDINDVVSYPDENVVYNKRLDKYFRGDEELKNWDSDPNSNANL